MLPDSCWIWLSGTGWGQNQFQKQMRFKWVTEIQKLWGSCAPLQSVGACTEKITLNMPVIRMCFREVINHAYSYSMDLSTVYEVWKPFTEWVKRENVIFPIFYILYNYNSNKTSVCRHQRISKTVWIYTLHLLTYELHQMWKNQASRSCNFWSNLNVR